MQSERRLIEGVLRGDRAALRELIAAYERLVRRIVGRLLDDPSEAEEVVQDVFVRVYRGLPNFRSDARLSTWIGRIAYNTAGKHLRRTTSRAAVEVAMADDTEMPAQMPPQLDAMLAEERREVIRSCVATLPRDQQLAITLHYVEGMSVSEVADVMDAPDNTVKSHLFRARKALARMLGEIDVG